MYRTRFVCKLLRKLCVTCFSLSNYTRFVSVVLGKSRGEGEMYRRDYMHRLGRIEFVGTRPYVSRKERLPSR